MNCPVSFDGVGLFTGLPVNVTIAPVSGGGIRFEHIDGRVCRATANLVTDTRRRTVVSSKHFRVQMVEHILAALGGIGITDAVIGLDAEELPMLDGSAWPYAEKLAAWNRRPQEWIQLEQIIEWRSESSRFTIEPHSGFAISYHLMSGSKEVCRYDFEWSAEAFLDDISKARTFAYTNEWPEISRLPGVNDRAGFLIMDSPIPGEFRGAGQFSTHCGTVLAFDAPRYPDEAARHKILDLIGDWTLLETRVGCHIHAWGTGHAENLMMVRRVARALQLDFSRLSF